MKETIEMKTYLNYCKLALLVLSTNLLHAQNCHEVLENSVLDGTFFEENVVTKPTIQYTHLSERDVMWSKRVWRSIDLREKMNHPLFYPEESTVNYMALWDVIRCATLKERSLTIYELGPDFDDQFRFPVKPSGNPNDSAYVAKLESFFGETSTIPMLDENDEPMIDDNGDQVFQDFTVQYEPRDIIRYEIKEDWFFDKQRSVMDVRIIGISPVVYYTNPQTGDVMGTRNLFWLYFPECRYVFQNFMVFNPHNDAQKMSFDDLFWKRKFSSYITKESNVFNRGIFPSWDGVDALLEADRIKADLFKTEHDLWHF